MPLKQRMYKHYSQANKEGISGIDGAIRKYGKENFLVYIIEECPDELLNEKECYYIEKFDTYYNGYNLTLGGALGSSQIQFDFNEVETLLNSEMSIRKASEKLNCCERTLSNYMKRVGLKSPYKSKGRPENLIGKGKQFKEGDGVKAVYCIELDRVFPSLKSCAEWLIANNYTSASSMDAVRKSLSRHLNGKRKSYLKMHFSYVEDC